TYRQLDARANRIARWIELREPERSRGGQVPASGSVRRSLVPFCGQRGLDQVAVQLAILKLGAAYVPLDARTPLERMRFLVEDTRADVLLTDATSRRDLTAAVAGLGRPVRLLDLDADAELVD